MKQLVKEKLQIFLNQKKNLFVFRLINVFFFLIGVFALVGIAQYSGNKPVNIFFFLFILVFLPLFLFIIGVVLSKISRDGETWAQQVLRKFYVQLGGIKENLSSNIFQKELALNGICYSFGALIALVLQISFSDVLFGWSSSLNIDSSSLHSFFYYLSLPWSWAIPDAAISQHLIEISEYFRSDRKFLLMNHGLAELKLMASWWKFLAMALIVYGVFPRFIGWLFFSVTEKKIDKVIEKSIFEYELDQLSSLFELSSEELFFYNSLLADLIANDIEKEKNIVLRGKKQHWYDSWCKLIFSKQKHSRVDIINIVKSEKKKNTKLFTIFCEASSFKAYYQLSDIEVERIDFDQNESILLLQKIASYCFDDYKKISNFNKRREDNLNSIDSNDLKKWIGLAFFSAGAIALTGGLGIGFGVALAKILGVASVSAKATGLALMGGGVFLLGNNNQDYKLFFGCGALFSAISEDSSFSKEYFKNKEHVKNDLIKLVTFHQFLFFSDDYLDYKQDFDYYLKEVAKKSNYFESLVRKVREKLLS